MPRALKFFTFVVVNVVIATIGTAILDTGLRRAIPTHSLTSVMWKECLFSMICAAGLGFSIRRIWRNSAAMWTWILPSIWFLVGLLAISGHSRVFGRPFVLSSGDMGVADIRSFFAFTVPFIRSVFYSVGAFLSSSFHPVSIVQRPSER